MLGSFLVLLSEQLPCYVVQPISPDDRQLSSVVLGSTTADSRFLSTAIGVSPAQYISLQYMQQSRLAACLHKIDSLPLEDVGADKDAQEDADEDIDIVVHGCVGVRQYFNMVPEQAFLPRSIIK